MKFLKRIFKIFKRKETYNSQLRRHRRELKRLINRSFDFDNQYLNDLVILKLKHMLEYYELGDRVYSASEWSDNIKKELKRALKYVENIYEYPFDEEQSRIMNFYRYIGRHNHKWRD